MEFPSPLLLRVASEFASKRRSAVLSAKDRHTHAVVIAHLLLGVNLSVMTPMDVEVDADINGESKRPIESCETKNIGCVLKRQKEAHSARVLVVPAPRGAPILHGPLVSVMTPTAVVVDVDTPGRWSPVKYQHTCVLVEFSVASASRRLKAARSAKVVVKAVAGGVFRGIAIHIGRYLSAMTLMDVVVDAGISGFLIALLFGKLSIAAETDPVVTRNITNKLSIHKITCQAVNSHC